MIKQRMMACAEFEKCRNATAVDLYSNEQVLSQFILRNILELSSFSYSKYCLTARNTVLTG